MSELHVAERPSWVCTGCREQWPCEPARLMLATVYDDSPVTLAVAMSIELTRAAGDLPGATAGELYRRFVLWTRPAPIEVLP